MIFRRPWNIDALTRRHYHHLLTTLQKAFIIETCQLAVPTVFANARKGDARGGGGWMVARGLIMIDCQLC